MFDTWKLECKQNVRNLKIRLQIKGFVLNQERKSRKSRNQESRNQSIKKSIKKSINQSIKKSRKSRKLL